MLFNSYEFIFFFMPATLVFFYLLSKLRFFRTATFSLVLASLVFYSYWDVRYIPLLIFSIVFNYLLGKAIERTLTMVTIFSWIRPFSVAFRGPEALGLEGLAVS
jgi:alginate O-acetyltransferase complex protein AlgI